MTNHSDIVASHDHAPDPYRRFLGMLVLSFWAMYLLMYAMVDKFADVIPNNNQIYMAALMTAPMAIIELLLMGSMYKNKTLNVAIIALAAVVLAGSFTLIRQQTGIGDVQFVKSMIPHHSGAILMCRGAKLQDPELRSLCDKIAAGQQQEIDQMRAILARLGRS